MKVTRKVTRVKLRIDQPDDFLLFGIVSSEPDYKLSLSLNKKFGISLKNSQPVKLPAEDGPELTFSRFSFAGASYGRTFSLISNRSDKNYLIRRLRNVDYLFYVHDPENEDDVNQITSRLREIHGITAVFNFEHGTIKDKNLHLVIQ